MSTTTARTRTEVTSTDGPKERKGVARRIWLWPVAILVSLPIGGYIADIIVDGVDSMGAALAGGLIVGAVIGAAEWFVLRHWVSSAWIPATIAGMTVGLIRGGGSGRLRDRPRRPGPHGCGERPRGWRHAGIGPRASSDPGCVLVGRGDPARLGDRLVRELYVISRNIDQRFPIFGASGAIVFGLLTWMVLAVLLRGASDRRETSNAAPR